MEIASFFFLRLGPYDYLCILRFCDRLFRLNRISENLIVVDFYKMFMGYVSMKVRLNN